MGAHTAAVGRKEKPTATASVRDPRAREPIPDRGTTVTRCQESILGRGNSIQFYTAILSDTISLGDKNHLANITTTMYSLQQE